MGNDVRFPRKVIRRNGSALDASNLSTIGNMAQKTIGFLANDVQNLATGRVFSGAAKGFACSNRRKVAYNLTLLSEQAA